MRNTGIVALSASYQPTTIDSGAYWWQNILDVATPVLCGMRYGPADLPPRLKDAAGAGLLGLATLRQSRAGLV